MSDWLKDKGIAELMDIRETLGRWISRAGSQPSGSVSGGIKPLIDGLNEVTRQIDKLIVGVRP